MVQRPGRSLKKTSSRERPWIEMRKYRVTLMEIHANPCLVQAESEEHALQLANERFVHGRGRMDFPFEFEGVTVFVRNHFDDPVRVELAEEEG